MYTPMREKKKKKRESGEIITLREILDAKGGKKDVI